MKTLILFVFLFLYPFNVHKEKVSKVNPDNFFQIKYETLLKKKETIGLSQIASYIEYIQLETKDDCLISGGKVWYFFTDDFIFITNRDHILKYSRSGKFIRKIGAPGRGPGEIDLIVNMSILPDKKLIVVQTNVGRKLLYFTFEGDFVKTVTFTSYVPYVKVLRDGKYLTHDDGGSGKNKYTFSLVNEKMDTLSVIKNYNRWVYTQNISIGIGYPQFEPYYESEGRNYFKTMYNDTVFSVSIDKIIPSYYIDLGKYRLPNELRPERLGPDNIQKFRDNGSNYYFANVFQGSDKLFLTSFCYGKNPPNYFLFKPESQTGSLLINRSSVSTGFINDWDGGLDFWPVGSVSDDKVFMPIKVLSIQKELERIKANKDPVKFSEQQKQLIKMITESDPFNNPILMIVTLKPNN
jgi:hypothetical protein